MFPNADPAASPPDASWAPHSNVETSVASNAPLIQVSPQQITVGSNTWPATFPLALNVPSHSNGMTPGSSHPLPSQPVQMAINPNRINASNQGIGTNRHPQNSHPNSLPNQGSMGVAIARHSLAPPNQLRSSTTQPTITTQGNVSGGDTLAQYIPQVQDPLPARARGSPMVRRGTPVGIQQAPIVQPGNFPLATPNFTRGQAYQASAPLRFSPVNTHVRAPAVGENSTLHNDIAASSVPTSAFQPGQTPLVIGSYGMPLQPNLPSALGQMRGPNGISLNHLSGGRGGPMGYTGSHPQTTAAINANDQGHSGVSDARLGVAPSSAFTTFPMASSAQAAQNLQQYLQLHQAYQARRALPQAPVYPRAQAVPYLTPSTSNTSTGMTPALNNSLPTIARTPVVPSQRMQYQQDVPSQEDSGLSTSIEANINLIVRQNMEPEMFLAPWPLIAHEGSSMQGPSEILFFNRTELGLGTLLYDCINHADNPTFLFGLGNQGVPTSWVEHLLPLNFPQAEYLNIEITWPGYANLRHQWRVKYLQRHANGENSSIAKRYLAKEIAAQFLALYDHIQENERRLLENNGSSNQAYFPTDGNWQLASSWIAKDRVKLVALEWSHGYTFRALFGVEV